jgi:RNA polymerase sigma-70 factor (ECF subfamily)
MPGKLKRLCKRAQQGDKDAATELLRLFYKQIFNYLRRLSGSSTDAEDLTQETFAKVWASLGGYRHKCSFSTWIHTIAYHTYLDWHRKPDRVVARSDQWWQERLDTNPGPFESVEEKRLAEEAYRLVEQLDKDQRQVIYLHFYQGLSLRQTAHVLGESPSTIKYRFRKVMKHLKSQMVRAETPEKGNAILQQVRKEGSDA